MTAPEIIDEIKAGKSVELSTRYVMAFLRECERLELPRMVIQLRFIGKRCVLTFPKEERA